MTEAHEPVRLGDALAATGAKVGLGHAVEMGKLWARWRDVVGPAIAAHVEPTSLRERVLRVRADSPAWATEIAYLRDEIRHSANSALGEEVIAEVRVWMRPGKVSGPNEAPHPPARGRHREPPASPQEAVERARAALVSMRAKSLRRGSAGGAGDGKIPARCYD